MDLKVSRGTQESQEMSLSSEFHMNNTKRNGLFQISRPEPIQFVRKPEDGFTFSLCLCVSTSPVVIGAAVAAVQHQKFDLSLDTAAVQHQ